MRLLIMGPQGVGKGTQAALLSEHYGIPAISTGDIFRYNIKNKTELGVEALTYINKGELVPDELTNKIVKDRLAMDDAKNGWILDGYPRTLEQAHVLRDMLAELGVSLDVVLEIQVDEDEVVARMLKRATEQNRADDTEPVIRHRLEIYHELTEPMATYYADQDLLQAIDGRGSIDEVSERIFAVLDGLNN